ATLYRRGGDDALLGKEALGAPEDVRQRQRIVLHEASHGRSSQLTSPDGRRPPPAAAGRKVTALGRRTRPGTGATARRRPRAAQAARRTSGRTDRRARP